MYCVLEPRDSEMKKMWSFRSSWARTQILKYLVASATIDFVFKFSVETQHSLRHQSVLRRENVFFSTDDLEANLPSRPTLIQHNSLDLVSPSSEPCHLPLTYFLLLCLVFTWLPISLLEQSNEFMYILTF